MNLLRQVYPCIPSWPGQLSPALGPLTLFPDTWSHFKTRVDTALPTQITAWCPPGHTTTPEQATVCSSSLKYDSTFEGLFPCPGGCCGTTTSAFSCVRCIPPNYVDPYTGKCRVSDAPVPVVLPHRLLGVSGFYARVTLPVNIPVPVSLTATPPSTICDVDHEYYQGICMPCIANHASNGQGACTPCAGNTYRHTSLYPTSSTVACVLDRPQYELFAFETTVVDRQPIIMIHNNTFLKRALSPVRRSSCVNTEPTGCQNSPPGFIAVPGSNPVKCPAYASGPPASYEGLGYPVPPCTACPRFSSWMEVSTGICHVCSYWGTIGFVKPANYSAGEWVQETVQNAAVAAARWNNPNATRILGQHTIEVFYPDLPGGVWAAACGNASTAQQGREFIEGTHVLCPAGTFSMGGIKCYPCPSSSWSGVGATQCTMVEPGFEMPSLFPFSNAQMVNHSLSIPLFAMTSLCNSSMPDILGCTSTYSWRLPFLPNVTTTRSGTFSFLEYLQDTGQLRTSNTSATICKAGQHSVPYGVCRDCAENWYQPNPGSTACIQCPPHTFTNYSTGSTACVPCGNNGTCVIPQTTTIDGPKCRPGFFVSLFEPNQHRVFCKRCSADSISTAVDSIRCTLCQAPFIPNANQTACRLCSSPFKADRASGTCIECPLNHYATNSSCVPCAAGSERPLSTLQCTPCTNHMVSPGDGSSCAPCADNTQSLQAVGGRVCTACTGRTVRFSKEATCHLCRPGSIWINSASGPACQLCPFLTVGGNNSISNVCTPCSSPNAVIGSSVCLDAHTSPLTNLSQHDEFRQMFWKDHQYVLVLAVLVAVGAVGFAATRYRHRPRLVTTTTPEAALE